MTTQSDKPNGPASIYVIGVANLLLGFIFAGFHAVNVLSQSAMQPAPTWVSHAIRSNEIAHFWFDWLPAVKGSLAIVSILAGALLLRDNPWGRSLTILWAIVLLAINAGSVAVMSLCVVPELRDQMQQAGGSGRNANSAATGALIVAALQSCYPLIIWLCMLRRPVTDFFRRHELEDMATGPPPNNYNEPVSDHSRSNDNPYRV